MKIEVEKIKLDVWEDGCPQWFHIEQYDSMISFTMREATAVRDALSNLIRCAERYNGVNK